MKLNNLSAVIQRAYALKMQGGHNVVPMLWGSPGIGKTQKMLQVVEEIRATIPEFKLWTMLGSTLSPTDIVAYMPDKATGKLHGFFNARLPDAAVEPDAQGIIFLDEAPNTHPETLKALQKLINEGHLDGLTLPAGAMFVLAGNRVSDRAGANKLSSAFSNRLSHYTMEADLDEVVEHFAEKGYPATVIGHLMSQPDSLDRFDDKTALTWPNPRTWERVCLTLLYNEQAGRRTTTADLAADIGEAEAKSFRAFLDETSKLPTRDDIKAAPDKIEVPKKISEQYALIAMLAYHVDKDSMEWMKKFVTRMELNRQVLFLKLMVKKPPEVKQTRAYREWLSNNEIVAALTGVGQ